MVPIALHLLVVGLGLFALVDSKASKLGQDHEPHLEKRIQQCVYENMTYTAGEKFQPDPCTFCHCPRRGGRVVCSIMDCKYDPGCVMYDTKSGECCGKCVERGCVHSDGKVYPKGTELTTDPCTKCFCPKNSQHTVCMKVECPMNTCVDAIKLPDQCCSYCPRGPNCLHKGKVLPGNRAVRVDSCHVCRCLPSLGIIGREAVCANTCKIFNGVIGEEMKKAVLPENNVKEEEKGGATNTENKDTSKDE